MSLFNAKMSSSLLLLGLLLWPGLFVPADGLGDGRNVYRTRKCMSRECKAATQDIYDALDTAADPCDDFFRFTCGKWNDRNPHSNDNKFDYKVRWETLDKNMSVKMIKVLRPVAKAGVERPTAVQFVMDLFNFCVTEEGREVGGSNPLQVLMQNNLELLSSSATNKVDWMRAVIETMVATSVNPLFVVTTEAIGNKINLKFAAPAFAKEYAQFKFDEQLARNQTKKGILEKFGAPLRAISDYEQIVDDFVAVEQQLAFAALHSQTRDKIDLDSLDDLNTRTGNLADWTDFANRLLKAWKLPATVTKEDVVSVVDVQYLGEMLKVVTNGTAIEKLVNYLSFAIYKSYDPYLVKPGQNIAEVCYGHVEAFTWVLVRLYVDNYVYRESKIIVTDIAEKIRQTFVDIIRKKRWLDRVDRDRLVNKMKKIRLVIGYPQMIMVDAMLDSFYGIASMHLDNTSYVLTVAQVKATLARSKLARLHNPTDDVDSFIFDPMTLNTWFATKQMVMTPLFFQRPYFHPRQPMLANFAAIGTVIAHELTHALDTNGITMNEWFMYETGWLKPTTRYFYDKYVECIREQYGATYDTATKQYLRANLTIDEDIADNGAVHVSWEAYRINMRDYGEEIPADRLANYTWKQLFFAAVGQIWCGTLGPEFRDYIINHGGHSLIDYRTNIPMTNMAQFVEAFNCTEGSKMNKDKLCRLW